MKKANKLIELAPPTLSPAAQEAMDILAKYKRQLVAQYFPLSGDDPTASDILRHPKTLEDVYQARNAIQSALDRMTKEFIDAGVFDSLGTSIVLPADQVNIAFDN